MSADNIRVTGSASEVNGPTFNHEQTISTLVYPSEHDIYNGAGLLQFELGTIGVAEQMPPGYSMYRSGNTTGLWQWSGDASDQTEDSTEVAF